MANAYVSVEPFTLSEVIRLAENQGYEVEITHRDRKGRPTMIDLTSADGEDDCHEMGEEESAEGETHVGSMGNPMIAGFEMAEEGSQEYNLICYGDPESDI